MIKPCAGRHVWYYPTGADVINKTIDAQPHAALVAHVFSDTLVNLAIFDSTGRPYNRTSVRLLQDNDEPQPGESYCAWMPNRKSQADNG
jgi:hypothetical protein